MKTKLNGLLVGVCVALVAIFFAGQACATLIDFDGVPAGFFDRLVPLTDAQYDGGFDNTFGSAAVGSSMMITGGNTPDIALNWGYSDDTPGGGTNHWYALAYGVDQLRGSVNDHVTTVSETLTLTAGAGWMVDMQSIELAWADKSPTGNLTVTVDGNPTDFPFSLPAGSTLVDLSGLSNGSLVTLFMNYSSGDAASVGWDNIEFNQVQVPEPAVLSLIGFGLLALAVKSRRRKR